MSVKQNYIDYKYHPRILELRACLIHKRLREEYGEEMSATMLRSLSTMFNCNWAILAQVFNKSNTVLNHMGVSKERKKQDIIFMGVLYDESRYDIARKYLNVSRAYLYQDKERHNPELFVNDEWVELLDTEVIVLNIPAYNIETKKFIISFELFMQTFANK